MATKEQQDATDRVRAQLLSQAHKHAAAVLVKDTTLTARAAEVVAPAVVDAVTAPLRAEHSQQLAGISGAQATRLGFAAVGVLALDLIMFATVAARGPRWARPVAGVAIAAHTAFFLHNRARAERVRAAARVETARSTARSRS